MSNRSTSVNITYSQAVVLCFLGQVGNFKFSYKLGLLIQHTLNTLSDTIELHNIDEIGYVKQKIVENKFEKLNQIFCERKHKEALAMAYIAIYRDILVFKKNGRIIGTAKICFECNQDVITATSKNTNEFGQSGDYEKLYKLLR